MARVRRDWRPLVAIGSVVTLGVFLFARITEGASSSRTSSGRKKPVKKGRLLCPVEEQKQPATHAKVGDFIVIKLLSDDGTFSESAWAKVLGEMDVDGARILRVELTSALSASGFKSLKSDKHGFSLAERLTILPECIYDIHQGPSPYYAMLCGLFLTEAGYSVPPEVVGLLPGDTVQVVIASSPLTAIGMPGEEGWTERIWVQVESIGEGGVVHGNVRSDPKKTTELKRNHRIDFAKDCIIRVQTF